LNGLCRKAIQGQERWKKWPKKVIRWIRLPGPYPPI
jgi:hypothetical protein